MSEFRTIEQQKTAVKKFIKELANLEKKYKVYIDGFCLTGGIREPLDTGNQWELEGDENGDE